MVLDPSCAARARTLVRQAIEYSLDDFEDVAAVVHALQDPADPVLEWDRVRRELLGKG